MRAQTAFKPFNFLEQNYFYIPAHSFHFSGQINIPPMADSSFPLYLSAMPAAFLPFRQLKPERIFWYIFISICHFVASTHTSFFASAFTGIAGTAAEIRIPIIIINTISFYVTFCFIAVLFLSAYMISLHLLLLEMRLLL